MAEYENGFVELRGMTPLRGWNFGGVRPDETAAGGDGRQWRMNAQRGRGRARAVCRCIHSSPPTYAAPARAWPDASGTITEGISKLLLLMTQRPSPAAFEILNSDQRHVHQST